MMDGKPMYDVGYEIALYEERYRVIDVQWDAHEGEYVYLCEPQDGERSTLLYADEMTTPWPDHVAAETDRLIAQANTLHGQTKRVVALTDEEIETLGTALWNARFDSGYVYGYSADDKAAFEALYDKLSVKEE